MGESTNDDDTANDENEVPESPATWENVVVGKAKEVFGHAIGDKDLTDQGEEQEEVAHEVREEYKDEHEA
jgi:uncharacterized protein YjbJ (UPF0337 family)